ncbi:hypothetical protein [Natronococcus jeotgali]|uniref:hypothetical protein n=1 Tax=Natronococcus jeotgali TaxID=413812 RepID=UPI001360B226|nr:hypothetical protein [Natronococcus jeotgali]
MSESGGPTAARSNDPRPAIRTGEDDAGYTDGSPHRTGFGRNVSRRGSAVRGGGQLRSSRLLRFSFDALSSTFVASIGEFLNIVLAEFALTGELVQYFECLDLLKSHPAVSASRSA